VSDKTAIEWAEASWNPLAGCSVVSPGCTNCYAMREAGRRLASSPKYRGLTLGSDAGPVWSGEVRLWEEALDLPLHWEKPRRVFVNSMSDLFHESVPDAWIDRIFAVMALCPRHVFQVLTKRAERMRDYLKRRSKNLSALMSWCVHLGGNGERHKGALTHWPLPNVWLGVSVEDQRRADERIPLLRATPAAVRWISYEPALGPLDLACPSSACRSLSDAHHVTCPTGNLAHAAVIDWVICGGESGPRARPAHPNWIRSIRDQCATAGVPFFFKQWGEWAPAPETMNYSEAAKWACDQGCEFEPWSSGDTLVRLGKRRAGRLLDGREWSQYPPVGAADDRARQFFGQALADNIATLRRPDNSGA
jgi:protein gp37